MSTEIVKPGKTLRDWLNSDSFKDAVADAAPKHLSKDRFVRLAILASTRVPKLAECKPETVLACLMDLSRMGLEPDGRRAHLIPFKRNVKDGSGWKTHYECQLIVDYKGLVELAMRSGKVSSIHADIVCEKDDFEYDRGVVTKHKINFREERGEMYAVWARCSMKDGGEACVVLAKYEVDAIRKRSKASGDGPWVTDYNEMAKKTAFRRLSKWIVLSDEWRDAIEKDEEYEGYRDTVEIRKPLFEALPAAPAAELPEPEGETIDIPADDPANAEEVFAELSKVNQQGGNAALFDDTPKRGRK